MNEHEMLKLPMNQIRDINRDQNLGINMLHKSKADLVSDILASQQYSKDVKIRAKTGSVPLTHTRTDETVPRMENRMPGESERVETREPQGRKKRIPLGTPKQKLWYAPREGYHRHWFNDQRSRIHDAKMAGYAFVLEEEDEREVKVGRVVGTKEDGTGLTAYLMEICQEYYEEDQRAKSRPLDEFDAQLRRNVPDPREAAPGDQESFYIPSEGSSISFEN